MGNFELNILHNESCLETMRRMPDKSIDLCLTDFPYGIGEEYDEFNDTKENLKQLIEQTMPEILRVSKRALITAGIKNLMLFPQPDWIMCWAVKRTNACCSWGFATWHPILCYGKDPYLENGLGSQMDYFEHSEIAEKNGHPCPKPITLWRKVLLRGSVKQTDIIFDPFMGSGTTAIACKKENRNWIGSEISEHYCQIAKEKIELYDAQPSLFSFGEEKKIIKKDDTAQTSIWNTANGI